jgi:hypothetical protein
LVIGTRTTWLSPIDPAPLQAQQVPAAETCVHGQFDRFFQERGLGDLAGFVEQPGELVLCQVAQAPGVRAEELDASHRTLGREVLLDAPVEEAAQDLEVAIDTRPLDHLGPRELDCIDHRRCHTRERRVQRDAGAPHFQRRRDERFECGDLDPRVLFVEFQGVAEGDHARSPRIPGAVLELRLPGCPRAARVTLAAKSTAPASAVRVADFNQPTARLLVPLRPPPEVARSSIVHEPFSLGSYSSR